MSGEAKLWASLKRVIPGISVRVENTALAGTADVWWSHGLVSAWIELKGGPFTSDLEIRPEQHIFGRRITLAPTDTHSLLLAHVDLKELWLLPHDGKLRHGTRDEWKARALAVHEGKDKWQLIKNTLLNLPGQ